MEKFDLDESIKEWQDYYNNPHKKKVNEFNKKIKEIFSDDVEDVLNDIYKGIVNLDEYYESHKHLLKLGDISFYQSKKWNKEYLNIMKVKSEIEVFNKSNTLQKLTISEVKDKLEIAKKDLNNLTVELTKRVELNTISKKYSDVVNESEVLKKKIKIYEAKEQLNMLKSLDGDYSIAIELLEKSISDSEQIKEL